MHITPNLAGIQNATGITKQAGLPALLARVAKSVKAGWNRGLGPSIDASKIPTSVIPPKSTLAQAKKVKIPTPTGGWGKGTAGASDIPPAYIPAERLANAKKVHLPSDWFGPKKPLSNTNSYDAQSMMRANAKANPQWTRERHLESMQNMGYSPNEYNIDDLFVPSTKAQQPQQLIELTY
jgi:hypothetical protein